MRPHTHTHTRLHARTRTHSPHIHTHLPGCTKCDLHSKLTCWVQQTEMWFVTCLVSVDQCSKEWAFHANMHTSCVASQMVVSSSFVRQHSWYIGRLCRFLTFGKASALLTKPVCCCHYLPIPAEFEQVFVPKETIECPTSDSFMVCHVCWVLSII